MLPALALVTTARPAGIIHISVMGPCPGGPSAAIGTFDSKNPPSYDGVTRSYACWAKTLARTLTLEILKSEDGSVVIFN